MKKIRKGKKILLILLAVIIVAIIGYLIVKVINKPQQEPPVEEFPESNIIIPLQSTVYSDMEVKNIVMELLKNNAQNGDHETLVTFEIHNTTGKKVEAQLYEAVLIGDNEEEIARMPGNPVNALEPGEVQRVNVVYRGDLTATKSIKLIGQ